MDITHDWEGFFRENSLLSDIANIGSLDQPVLEVSYKDIAIFNTRLADDILDHPIETIKEGEEKMLDLQGPRHRVTPRLRITNLPKSERVSIRDIRADHIGRLIAVEGLVKRATEVRPIIVYAAYRCNGCGMVTKYRQTSIVPQPPLSCDREQDGCGASVGRVRLTPVWEESVHANSQKLEMQENPDDLKGGAQPQGISVYCMDDLTGKVNPGDRVIINGILRPADTGDKVKSNIQDIQLDAVSIEMEQKDFDEIEITSEDEAEIKEACGDPDLIPNLVKSIAPTIHGYDIEKESMALQLFGGVEKLLEDGTKIRGDVHILLVGDPGVAKSQMLRYMSGMAPRGVYVSGKSTSAAGLIAAAVKDDFGEGRWTLEAGALVLADRGLATVDELDKMSEQDRSALHEAMEAQQVHVSKAGINATLQCRFSMLAACNPEYGRFDENSALSEQINLPPSLLSRFDLIFAMTDKVNSERDGQITDHILSSHSRGEALRAGDVKTLEATKQLKPIYDRQFVRKLVAYTRKVYPVLSDEAKSLIRSRYLDIRKKGEGEDKSVPITARQLEAYVRLSEASARSRLSPTVDLQDAERAVKIVGYFLQKMANNGDIDAIEANFTHSKRGKMEAITSILKATPQPISKQELEEKLDGKVKPDELESMLDQLHRNGRVSESRGKYAIV